MKNLPYPTSDEVEAADRLTLAKWFRFLPTPGSAWVEVADYEKMEEESLLMDRIIERFKTMGGMSAEISKQIGW